MLMKTLLVILTNDVSMSFTLSNLLSIMGNAWSFSARNNLISRGSMNSDSAGPIDTCEKSIPFLEALRLGTPLAVEMPASDPEWLAGVVIVPLREAVDLQAKREGWKARVLDRRFRVRWREYDRLRAERDDWDLSPGNGIWEVKQAEVVGEQALEHLLMEWGVPLENLTYLWKTKLPE
jgi:hypothetical protein